MTLSVKLLLIATLILSIIIPFGYYLIGEKNKKRYKRAIGTNVFFFFGALVIAGIMLLGGNPVHAADATTAPKSFCNQNLLSRSRIYTEFITSFHELSPV